MTERDMERARGLPYSWLVTEDVTVKTTEIIYLLFIKYLLTSTVVVVENFNTKTLYLVRLSTSRQVRLSHGGIWAVIIGESF